MSHKESITGKNNGEPKAKAKGKVRDAMRCGDEIKVRLMMVGNQSKVIMKL